MLAVITLGHTFLMAFTKYLQRMERIHSLIKRKARGTLEELAEKMGIRRSSLMEHSKEMKEFGSPIFYDKERQTYYYECAVSFEFGFRKLDEEEMEPIKGGNFLGFSTVKKYWTLDQYVGSASFYEI